MNWLIIVVSPLPVPDTEVNTFVGWTPNKKACLIWMHSQDLQMISVTEVDILASEDGYHAAHVTLRDGTVISVSGRVTDVTVTDPQEKNKNV